MHYCGKAGVNHQLQRSSATEANKADGEPDGDFPSPHRIHEVVMVVRKIKEGR